jgi:pimeloyl-ACP methyl ester carboxylesterase
MDRDADLTPPALARLVVEVIDRLELEKPVVVANDTGGALAQIAMAEQGEKLGPVVLASCDAFENFFPPLFRYLSVAAHVPGSAFLLGQTTRLKLVQRTPIAFGRLTREPVPPEYMESYGAPIRSSAGVRRDVTKVLRGINRRHTLAAAKKLPGFEEPVLLAWADDGRVFPVEDAKRLDEILPDARLEIVENSYAFVPEDQPERLAALIAEFAKQAARKPSGRQA